jgi:hypothetical protein
MGLQVVGMFIGSFMDDVTYVRDVFEVLIFMCESILIVLVVLLDVIIVLTKLVTFGEA